MPRPRAEAAMARIIFLIPFSKSEITGGIKTVYRHAEFLNELGFDAFVYQPEGVPSWFQTKAKVLAGANVPALPCQAQFYSLFNAVPPARYRSLGFSSVVCQSEIAKGFLTRVLGFSDVAVVPCAIDTKLFYPRAKRRQIALIPKKLPREAAVIEAIFKLKYPKLDLAWRKIENASERDTAEVFGESEIVLSLPFLESFGLVPLEAMVSGAIVIGFDGYGGQEYASDENGFWFRPDRLEDVADAIARVAQGIAAGDPLLKKMREAGFATAGHYNEARTKEALRQFYGGLI
jgi:hypothetical protein